MDYYWVMKDLVKAQEEYIEFLETCAGAYAGYMIAHNIQESEENIQEGIKLRKAIEDKKGELGW